MAAGWVRTAEKQKGSPHAGDSVNPKYASIQSESPTAGAREKERAVCSGVRPSLLFGEDALDVARLVQDPNDLDTHTHAGRCGPEIDQVRVLENHFAADTEPELRTTSSQLGILTRASAGLANRLHYA